MEIGTSRGWKSAVRVRILHAQVRKRIREGKGREGTYDQLLMGVPINQQLVIFHSRPDFEFTLLYSQGFGNGTGVVYDCSFVEFAKARSQIEQEGGRELSSCLDSSWVCPSFPSLNSILQNAHKTKITTASTSEWTRDSSPNFMHNPFPSPNRTLPV